MLCAEFGKSKEDKCCQLAAELSAIHQVRGRSVEQFAFKYKKLLHQLEKLGEKIAKIFPPTQKIFPPTLLYVISQFISQFISKVNPSIAQ